MPAKHCAKPRTAKTSFISAWSRLLQRQPIGFEKMNSNEVTASEYEVIRQDLQRAEKRRKPLSYRLLRFRLSTAAFSLSLFACVDQRPVSAFVRDVVGSSAIHCGTFSFDASEDEVSKAMTCALMAKDQGKPFL